MIEWPLKKSSIVELGDKLIDPCWLPINKDVKKQQLSEKVSEEFFITGSKEELLKEIVKSIQKATKLICVCSFIISEPRVVMELLKSVERGIDIYLLTASEKRLKDPSFARDEVEVDDIKEHEELLNRLAGRVLVRTADFFHSKLLLIDPHDPKIRTGFLLSPNLAKKTFDRKLELGLKLSSEEVGEFFKQFVIGFWDLSQHELMEPNQIRGIKREVLFSSPDTIDTIFTDHILYTFPFKLKLKSNIKDIINNSKGSLYISSFSFEKNHELVELLKKQAKNREVIIFSRVRPLNMPTLIDLCEAGAIVYGHPDLHAKGIIGNVKGKLQGIMMTANFETKGIDEGFESGLFIEKKRAEQLLKIFNNWEITFPTKLSVTLPRREFQGDLRIWRNQEFQGETIEAVREIDLGTFNVPTFDELESYTPQFPKLEENSSKYHRIIYSWTNIPPQLPLKANFIERKKKFDLYEHNSMKYVVVPKPKDYNNAIKIAKEEKAKIVIKI